MSDIDHALRAAVSESVTKIRGKRPRNPLNKRLGFIGNQLQRWESGARQPSWPDFIQLCEVCQVPVARALDASLQFSGNPRNPANILTHLLGQSKLNVFSKTVGETSSTISKWKSGKAVPTFLQMLTVIERGQGLAVHFLDALFAEDPLQALDKIRQERKRLREPLASMPESSGLLAILSLKKSFTKEDAQASATTLGIEAKRFSEIFTRLEEAGWIERNGEDYHLSAFRLDARGDLEVNRALRQHWLSESRKILDTAQSLRHPHRFGVLLITLSEETDRQIEELYQNFFGSLKQIVDSDKGAKNCLRVISVQDILVNKNI